MGKDKKQKGKAGDASVNQIAGSGPLTLNETAATVDKDETIERLTQKKQQLHDELVRDTAKLNKEREILQNMAERRMTQQALLNENVGSIDRMFTLDSTGLYYKYTGKKKCCLDTVFAKPCAARNTSGDISCRHEICSRAETQGITYEEFGTIRYYEMRMYVEKTERKKNALRKQREVELARLKKIEDEGNAAKARKAEIIDKENKGLGTEKAAMSQLIGELMPHPILEQQIEEDLQAAMFAARVEMMQNSKQIAMLAGSKQNREDFKKIQAEVNATQFQIQQGRVDHTELLESLEQATLRLKNYERREKLFDLALKEFGLSPSGEVAATTPAAMMTGKPSSALIKSPIKPPEFGFSTSVERAHAMMAASLRFLASGDQRQLYTEQEKKNTFSEQHASETENKILTNDIITVIVDLRQKLQGTVFKHMGWNPTLGTRRGYEESLRIELAALRDIEQECQRLVDASLETVTISLESIKAAAIVKSSIPPLTDLVLDVVVSTWLDLHRARHILYKLDQLSDKELDGQIICAVLMRAEKRPEWYLESISVVKMAFETTMLEPPEQIYHALSRVRRRVQQRLKKISHTTAVSSPTSDNPKPMSIVQVDAEHDASYGRDAAIVATGDPNLHARSLNISPKQQIDDVKKLILYQPFASQDLLAFIASLYQCGYSPGCGFIQIVHILTDLADRGSRRLNEEIENIAKIFADTIAPLLPGSGKDQATWPVWRQTLQELMKALFDVTMTITTCVKDLYTQKRLPSIVLHTACNIMSTLVLSPGREHLEDCLSAFQIFVGGKFDSEAATLDVLTHELLKMAQESRFLCNINVGYCRYHAGIADESVATVLEEDDPQQGVPSTASVKEEGLISISQELSTTTRMQSFIVRQTRRREILPHKTSRPMQEMDKILIMKELAELSTGNSQNVELSCAIGEKVLRLGKLQREAYRQAGKAISSDFEHGIASAERAITRRNEEYKTALYTKGAEEDQEAAEKSSKFVEDFSEETFNIQGHDFTRHEIRIMEHETIDRLQGIVKGKANVVFCCWVAYNVKLQAESALDPSEPFKTFTNILNDFGSIPKALSLALDVVKEKTPYRAEYLVQYPQYQWKGITYIMDIMKKIEANKISFSRENDESRRTTPWWERLDLRACSSQGPTSIGIHDTLEGLSSELGTLVDVMDSPTESLHMQRNPVSEGFGKLTAKEKMTVIGELEKARKLSVRPEATVMGTEKQLADANLVPEPLVISKSGFGMEELKYCDYLARLPSSFRRFNPPSTTPAPEHLNNIAAEGADLKRRNEFQGSLEAFMSNVAELSDAIGYLAQQEKRWLQPLREVVEAVDFMAWNILHISRIMVTASGWEDIAHDIDETLVGDGIVEEDKEWSIAGNVGDSD